MSPTYLLRKGFRLRLKVVTSRTEVSNFGSGPYLPKITRSMRKRGKKQCESNLSFINKAFVILKSILDTFLAFPYLKDIRGSRVPGNS